MFVGIAPAMLAIERSHGTNAAALVGAVLGDCPVYQAVDTSPSRVSCTMPAQACLFLKETSLAKANLAHAPRCAPAVCIRP